MQGISYLEREGDRGRQRERDIDIEREIDGERESSGLGSGIMLTPGQRRPIRETETK
jgi:hypothetical protein